MKKKILLSLMLFVLSLVFAFAGFACSDGNSGGSPVKPINPNEIFGFSVPSEEYVTVRSEYKLPIPLVTDKDGNGYQVKYSVTLDGEKINTAGNTFIVNEIGDYVITYTLVDSKIEPIKTVLHSRKRAEVVADRNELYVGETVTAERLGIKVLTEESVLTTGFDFTITDANGEVVNGVIANEDDYIVNVNMLNDTYYVNATMCMQSVNALAVQLDLTNVNVMVGESVDLDSLNPNVVNRATDEKLNGYTFKYKTEDATIVDSTFTATDALGQKIVVTATKDSSTVQTTIVIPTYATLQQTKELYNELATVVNKDTVEFYANGVKLQHFYDSLSNNDKNNISVSAQQIEYLAGGVEYGSGKLVYFDTAYGEKQVKNVTDHSEKSVEGEFLFETNKHEFVKDANVFVGEKGALKLNVLPARYSIKVTLDIKKIPYDLNNLSVFGFKIYHNGEMGRTKNVNVGIQLSTATKKDVQASAFKTGFADNQENLVKFNFKDFNLVKLFGEGTTVDDLVDMSITIYDGLYHTYDMRDDFYCYISPVYVMDETAQQFTVEPIKERFDVNEKLFTENFNTSTDKACKYSVIDLKGNWSYIGKEGFTFVEPGIYTIVSEIINLPYQGSARCEVYVNASASYLQSLIDELVELKEQYGIRSNEFNKTMIKFKSAFSLIKPGEVFDVDAATDQIFGTTELDETQTFDLSNEKGTAALSIYDVNIDLYRQGNRTVGTNYTFEETDIFKEVTGQTSALKFTKPLNGEKPSIFIQFSSLFGASGTKPSDFSGLVFYIKSNHDTKGYTWSTLQLDFAGINSNNGQETPNKWKQRVNDGTKGQVIKITVPAAQLLNWGNTWDNAGLWICFADGGRWDLGQASDDFYLYISSMKAYTQDDLLNEVVNKAKSIADKNSAEFISALEEVKSLYSSLDNPSQTLESIINGIYEDCGYTLDNKVLFDLSNPLGSSSLSFYDINIDSYRTGGRNIATNYTFETTNVFEEVTGQTSALKFTKPLNGNKPSILLKLSQLFNTNGTKPSDYEALSFYVTSNHDTKGYTWATLQLDFVALNSSNGRDTSTKWTQRVSDSKKGELVLIEISKAQLQEWGDSWDNAMIWIYFADGGRWDLGQASNDFYLYVSSMSEHIFSQKLMTKETFISYDQSTHIANYRKTCACGKMSDTQTFEINVDPSVDLTPLAPTVAFYETNGVEEDYISYGFNWYTLNNPYYTLFYIKKSGEENFVEYDTEVVTEVYDSFAVGANINDKPVTTKKLFVSKIELLLDANSTYIYKIADKFIGDTSEEFVLYTTSLNDNIVKFAAYADTQGGDYSAQGGDYTGKSFFNALSHTSNDVDFYIHSGDIVEQALFEEYWRYILDDNRTYLASKPLMAVAGNHETNYASHSGGAGKNELGKYFNYNVPQQDMTNGVYYSYTYGNVKFIYLNTNPIRFNGLEKAQYDWLINELENNDKDWLIVNMHCPLYSVGEYGVGLSNYNSVMTEKKRDQAIGLRNQLSSIFAKYGVDLVIQGHDHLVSKTYPIGQDGNIAPAYNETINGITYDVNPNGTIYVMNGTTGNQTGSLKKHANDLATVGEKKFYNTLYDGHKSSWAEYEIVGNTLTVKVMYYDENTKTVKTYYEWGIKKDGFAIGPDGYNEFKNMTLDSTYYCGDEIVLPKGLVYTLTNADKLDVFNNVITIPENIDGEFDVIITADYSQLGGEYGVITKTIHITFATLEHKIERLKAMDMFNTATFRTKLAELKAYYDTLDNPEKTYEEILAEVFEGYTLNKDALFDLSSPYGVTAISTPNKDGVSDTNYSIVPFDKFEGQTSALKVTCNTVGVDTSLRIKFSNLFTTVTPKDCVNGIRFMIYSNGRYTTVKQDPENWVNNGGVAMSATSSGANVVATVTIKGTELANYNSWDEVMIKIRCNSWNNINDPRLEFYLSNVYVIDPIKDFNKAVDKAKAVSDKNSTQFRTALNEVKSAYNTLNNYERTLEQVLAEIFEGYTLDQNALFDLSNAYGVSGVNIYGSSRGAYANGTRTNAYNYTIETTDTFYAVTGQTSAIKFTKPAATDQALIIRLSDMFGASGTKPTDYNELTFFIKSNFDTKGYTYSKLQLDFVALNAVNGAESGWRQRVKDSNSGQVVQVTIDKAQLERWGDSWDNAAIWILFATGGRWDLGLASDDFYLYISSMYTINDLFDISVEKAKGIEDKNSEEFKTAIFNVKTSYSGLDGYNKTLEEVLAEIFEGYTLDQNALFDFSSAYGISGVNIYSDSRGAYANGARTNAYNYTVETTDTFNAVTGQTSAIKFTKPLATDHALIIKLSDMFGANGTKPSDYDGLVFYIKSNFDTKGYTYSKLQLDFVALNAVNGAESGWKQRVKDSNSGQVVQVTVDKAQLERWGNSWDNAAIWIIFATGGRWDLGLASNDFYLYVSNIQGYNLDNSKLFDLSNPLGTSALTIYDENMSNYRSGSSKRLANNYSFETTDVFKEVTGQTSAIKFVKPLNGSNTSPLIKLSSILGASGTKPTDYNELTFYINSNFDTKGYTYSKLQLDFVALMSSDGSESGWRQRVKDSNSGQVVQITIDRAQLERWGDSWDNAMIWILFATEGRWDLGLASNDFYLYVSSITGTLAQ